MSLLLVLEWNEWEEWGACSTENTCGRGVKVRQRTCSNGGIPGVDRYCLGFTNQTAPCRRIACRGKFISLGMLILA